MDVEVAWANYFIIRELFLNGIHFGCISEGDNGWYPSTNYYILLWCVNIYVLEEILAFDCRRNISNIRGISE